MYSAVILQSQHNTSAQLFFSSPINVMFKNKHQLYSTVVTKASYRINIHCRRSSITMRLKTQDPFYLFIQLVILGNDKNALVFPGCTATRCKFQVGCMLAYIATIIRSISVRIGYVKATTKTSVAKNNGGIFLASHACQL